MQKRFDRWRSPVAATLLLVLLIGAASFIVTEQINKREEAASFERLEEEAEELARVFEQTMTTDREKLTLIAEMMADDMGMMERLLGMYQNAGDFFTRLELLLPDGQLITTGGERLDVSGQLSFEEIAALGAHISDRERDYDGNDKEVRNYVPVERDGETIAMLCGVIELQTLAQNLPYTPYSGEAAVYVVDGATGDFLIDTWHTGAELGNIWDLGSRPLADGYDDAQLRQGLVDGERNFVVFVSNTTKEYLYFYYAPLAVNQWRVALSVPMDLVFAGARSIRTILNLLLATESVIFLLYIGWMVLYVRRETGEKQRQLDALNYIYDVEKLLFTAHEHRENVSQSLEVIARMLPAHRVAFVMLENDGKNLEFLWEEGGPSALGKALLENTQAMAAAFSDGQREIAAGSAQEVREVLPMAPAGMLDLAAVPVEDASGALRGILAASGLARLAGCTAMLRGVGLSYAMLWGNTHTYQEMKRQGTEDILTGLYNRNRYEADLKRIAEFCRRTICCIYIDANGLHELNNRQGHEAGDRMLQAVSREIERRFGRKWSYRVGGDEFVIFAVDADQDRILHHSRAISYALEQQGYHVSVGLACAEAPVDDLEQLVTTAEKRMYDAKQAFYEMPGSTRDSRR